MSRRTSWTVCCSFGSTLRRTSALLLLSALVAAPAAGDDQAAYVIIKASVLQEEVDQPDWIVLCGERKRCEKYDATTVVHQVEPGRYYIDRIELSAASNGQDYVVDGVEINAEAGHIYLYSHFQFNRITAVKLTVRQSYGPALVEEACAEHPEIFADHPVVIVDTGEQFNVSCDFAVQSE